MDKVFKAINKTRPHLDYIIFGLILMTVPWFIENTEWFRFGWLTFVGTFIVLTIASLGKNILLSYGGLASLGTAGFMAVGAYLTALLTTELGLPFFTVLAITIVATMFLGLLVGLLASRVEGFFLAIATLVIAEIFRQVFLQVEIFNGTIGLRLPGFPEIFGHQLDRNQAYYVLVGFLVLAMMLTYRIFKSPAGRAMSAMSGSQSAASAMGVNIFRYRLVTFAIATGFAGAAGSLFITLTPTSMINPDMWGLITSLSIFAIIVIGGGRSVAGTVLGAFIVSIIPDIILPNVPVIGDINGMGFVFTGVLIIVVVLFSPAGLIYLWWGAWYKFKAKILGLFSSRKGGVA